ncbi:MAG: hypothetical protein R3C02_14470 [Planctomycetaceae bacterium]
MLIDGRLPRLIGGMDALLMKSGTPAFAADFFRTLGGTSDEALQVAGRHMACRRLHDLDGVVNHSLLFSFPEVGVLASLSVWSGRLANGS